MIGPVVLLASPGDPGAFGTEQSQNLTKTWNQNTEATDRGIRGKLEPGGMGLQGMDTKRPPGGDPVVSEIVRRLVDAYHPERVYLFGSVARGAAGKDSDYDFMVIVPDDAPPELRTSATGYRALRDVPVPADLVVFRKSSFDKRLHLKASFPATIVREGKLLYAA